MQGKPVDITKRGKKIIADAYMQLIAEGASSGVIKQLAVDWGIDISTMQLILKDHYTDDEINFLREQNRKAFSQLRRYSPPGSIKPGSHWRLCMEERGIGRYIKRPGRKSI